MDKDYLQELFVKEAKSVLSKDADGASNMDSGTGKGSMQQMADGVADGFDFTGKNPNATALDATLTGKIPYGATGDFASSFGGKSSAQGKRSHAEGTTTIAKGKYSHVEGDNSVALGNDSHAEGLQTLSAGTASHSEGSYGTALGHSSHSEGIKTSAEGNYSHTEGGETRTIGAFSHAEGYGTVARGEASHAEGDRTEAIGSASHASGVGTIAARAAQMSIGAYNIGKEDTLFEIGHGKKADEVITRINVFEVYADGTVGIKYGNNIYSLQKILAALSGFIDSAKL